MKNIAACLPLIKSFLLLLHSQREIYGCPFTNSPLRPDRTAVAANDAFDDGKTDSCTLKLLLLVQPMEREEHLVCVDLVEASTGVSERYESRTSIGGQKKS